MAIASLNWVPFGCLHHATFKMQSPPLDGEEFRAFIRSEVRAMQELGLNSFCVNLSWSDLESAEGEWDFSATDAAVEACEEFGLKVFLWVWPELTPLWFAKTHPEALATAASGFQSRMFSQGHPIARQHVKRFMQTAVARYASRDIVAGYDIAIEAGLWWNQRPDSDAVADRLWDYNPAVIESYRSWLQARYGNLQELNRAHRTNYRDFSSVEPVRMRYFVEQAMLCSHVSWLDWRLFSCHVFSDFMRFKVECVREIDNARPIADQTHEVDPSYSLQDIWEIGKAVDVMGVSMFTSNVKGDYMSTNWLMDRHRSAGRGKPLWVWELRAGQTTWGINSWGEPIEAADVARFTWQVFSNGATCAQYWNWRPHMGGVEVGGHGLTRRDGTLTDRAERAREIASALRDDLLTRVKPERAQIAVHDSNASRIVAAGEGSDAAVVSAQRDCYSALRSQGFAVDFVNDEMILEGALQSYKLLCLPFAYVLEGEVAASILEYAHGGGHVYAGAFCAAKNGQGFGSDRVPGGGLHELFGCEEVRTTPVFATHDAATSTLGASFSVPTTGRPFLFVNQSLHPQGALQSGDSFEGFKFLQSVRVLESAQDSASVIARDERENPLVVLNRCGSGAGLFFGSLPGRDEDFGLDGFARLLGDFARLAGVSPVVEIAARENRALEARLLVSKDDGREALLIVLNSEREAAEVGVQLRDYLIENARDYVSGAKIDHEGARLTVTVAARDARAIRLEVTR